MTPEQARKRSDEAGDDASELNNLLNDLILDYEQALDALQAIVTCDLELANGGYAKHGYEDVSQMGACIDDMGKAAADALAKLDGR